MPSTVSIAPFTQNEVDQALPLQTLPIQNGGQTVAQTEGNEVIWMKPISAKLGVNPIFIGIVLFCFSEGLGADWKIYASSNDEGTYFYDTEGVRQVSKDIVQVWEKRVFPPEKVQRYVGKFGLKYKELDYGIRLLELNCNERKFRSLQATYYKKDGLIDHFNFEAMGASVWHLVLPETTGDKLLNTICGKNGIESR